MDDEIDPVAALSKYLEIVATIHITGTPLSSGTMTAYLVPQAYLDRQQALAACAWWN